MAESNPFSLFGEMDLEKMMKDFKMPGLDVDGLLSSQRKNLEAIGEANKVAMEGMQAVAQRQTEIMREAMEEMAKATQSMAAIGMPYGEMERKGWFMPVVEIGIRYLSAARFEDPIRVETSIVEVRGARIRFRYRAYHDGEDRLLYEGFTVLGCTDAGGRPVRLPAEVRERALAELEAE